MLLRHNAAQNVGFHAGKEIARLLLLEQRFGALLRGRQTRGLAPLRFARPRVVPVGAAALGIDRRLPKGGGGCCCCGCGNNFCIIRVLDAAAAVLLALGVSSSSSAVVVVVVVALLLLLRLLR